jgi:hypothetical protein
MNQQVFLLENPTGIMKREHILGREHGRVEGGCGRCSTSQESNAQIPGPIRSLADFFPEHPQVN